MTANGPTILDVIPDFFAAFSAPVWSAWRTALAALFALAPGDVAVYRDCTAREQWPAIPAREGWFIVGRRGGKSRIMALVAVYLACFRRHQLAPGERGVLMVIAADRRQARVVKGYIVGLIDAVPMLRALVANRTRESVELTNGLTIEIHTASFRAVRGYTVVGAVLDELAFWPVDDAANPDAEVLAALRPAMATVPGAMLLVISSPYARRGELWRTYRDHYGKDGDVLVWKADTRTMNPTVPASVIEGAYDADPARAAAEWGAEFRTDVETFIGAEAVAAVVEPECRERPRCLDVAHVAFVDPSGGSGDSMTLAIAHHEDGRAVLDALREVRPPFSPESVVEDFAALCRLYGVSAVTGDRYGGEWPRERFRKHGIDYQLSDRTRSDLYRDLLPAVNSGQVTLLDEPRLIAQLANLERRTGRGGRDVIDHAPGGHDDVANAAAGALTLALRATARTPRVYLL